ncbi:MAG TPA: DNA ligase-associated DEXH box helicase [Fusobacteria bacterium]|mgnify:CR=1 FL=1|nr:DNA ligase-associated DEXH box helicase [Fusobacteriota bacterium]
MISRKNGNLYCEAGDFYIDPSSSVENAVVTHAHSDHLSSKSENNFCSKGTEKLIKVRLSKPKTVGYDFGEKFYINGVMLSFHPAGHILGSSQVRIEHRGKVVVVTGDYKRGVDYSCKPFELVECDEIISEATFAMPFYKWPDPMKEVQKIIEWSEGSSVLFCYSLGKSQQVITLLNRAGYKDIYVHPVIDRINKIYIEEGYPMTYQKIDDLEDHHFKGITILPYASSKGIKEEVKTASISGWNMTRNGMGRGGCDAGFVMSGHAGWSEIVKTVKESKANKIYFHHGRSDVIIKYLNENGYNTHEI